MASGSDQSIRYYQGFSNRWFSILCFSKTSKEAIFMWLLCACYLWVKIHSFIVSRQVNWNYFLSLLIYRTDTYYDNFGVFYNNTLSYLFTNPERDVVKHNIDNPKDVPRHIPHTRIPNQHIPNKEIANQLTGSVITGVHVGYYFWIFGGIKHHGPIDSLSSLCAAVWITLQWKL